MRLEDLLAGKAKGQSVEKFARTEALGTMTIPSDVYSRAMNILFSKLPEIERGEGEHLLQMAADSWVVREYFDALWSMYPTKQLPGIALEAAAHELADYGSRLFREQRRHVWQHGEEPTTYVPMDPMVKEYELRDRFGTSLEDAIHWALGKAFDHVYQRVGGYRGALDPGTPEEFDLHLWEAFDRRMPAYFETLKHYADQISMDQSMRTYGDFATRIDQKAIELVLPEAQQIIEEARGRMPRRYGGYETEGRGY